MSAVGVYKKFPKELFRLNKGPYVRLREYKSRRGPCYDVVANNDGNVEPRALDLATYAGKRVKIPLPGLVPSDVKLHGHNAQLLTGHRCARTPRRCDPPPGVSPLLKLWYIPSLQVVQDPSSQDCALDVHP